MVVFPPVPFLHRLQVINAAIVTNSIVAAQLCSALRTLPLPIFTLDKSSKRMLLDEVEIFNKTCAVMLFVTCVNTRQVAAREIAAFATKPDFVFQKEVASFL